MTKLKKQPMIKNFEELRNQLLSCGAPRRIAVVCANDDATRSALRQAEEQGIAQPVYFDDDNPAEAAAQAEAEAEATSENAEATEETTETTEA